MIALFASRACREWIDCVHRHAAHEAREREGYGWTYTALQDYIKLGIRVIETRATLTATEEYRTVAAAEPAALDALLRMHVEKCSICKRPTP